MVSSFWLLLVSPLLYVTGEHLLSVTALARTRLNVSLPSLVTV